MNSCVDEYICPGRPSSGPCGRRVSLLEAGHSESADRRHMRTRWMCCAFVFPDAYGLGFSNSQERVGVVRVGEFAKQARFGGVVEFCRIENVNRCVRDKIHRHQEQQSTLCLKEKARFSFCAVLV